MIRGEVIDPRLGTGSRRPDGGIREGFPERRKDFFPGVEPGAGAVCRIRQDDSIDVVAAPGRVGRGVNLGILGEILKQDGGSVKDRIRIQEQDRIGFEPVPN